MDNLTLKPMVFIEKTKTALTRFGKRQKIPKPTAVDVIFFCMAFLCGRATLLGTLRPFGGAFFSATAYHKKGYIYMLAAILGQISSGAPLYEAGKYIFAMTVFALICDRLPNKSREKPLIRGVLFTSALLGAGCFFSFASTRGMAFTTLYDLITLSAECAVAFCATWAFSSAVPIIKRFKLSYTFSTREEVCLVTLLGCTLWGAKDITNIGFINLSNIIGILIILTFSVRLGSGRGVISGLIMGLVSSLGSGRIDISCVSYAFSSLAASLLGGYGAIPACTAFIVSNALVTALANGSTEVLINIYDIFTACIIYSFIPEKYLLRLTSFGARDEKNRIAADERSYSEYVLSNARSTVDALSVRMEKLDENRFVRDEAESKFYERVARRACSGCGMRRLCWNRDTKKTTLSLKTALNDYRRTYQLNCDLLPENCLRAREMRDAFIQMAEIYRTDLVWQSKLYELKNASLKQLHAFSQILSATARSLSDSQSFDRALSDDISRKLSEANIKHGDIVVLRDKDFDPTVMLKLENCGGFALCEKGAEEVISTACGQKMVRAGKRDCKNCNIKYVVAPPSSVSFAASCRSRDKKKPSGDTALVRVINKSLYAAVLCDGMGYGEKAAFEAKGAAETLLDLVEAGLSGESAMEIVNSLLLPYGEVTFSAVDLCLYDANERRAKIIKSGSAASFTKSGERVDALYSKTMPLGSLFKNEVETFTLSPKEGDIIVMISDGVLESVAEGALKDTWLIRELENFHGDDVARLADLIVEKSLEKCGSDPRDDITVLTAYIE